MNKQRPYVPQQFEYPKRLTARNEEGKCIQTRATCQEQYAKGWDAIFNKPKESQDEI